MKVSKLIVGLILISSTCYGEEIKHTITVIGNGKISVKPDIVEISIGVKTSNSNAVNALAANNAAMNNLFTKLQSFSISEKDIQTQEFSLRPQYTERSINSTTEFYPKLIGYIALNEINIIVRDLRKIGSLLDELVKEGANMINNIQFKVDHIDNLLDETRKNAMKSAKNKAELLAKEAGVKLGSPINIIEVTNRPYYESNLSANSLALSAPIASGEKEISTTVSVVYEMEK